MAFSKSRSGGQEGKSLGQVSGEPAPGFGGVGETSLFDQGEHKIVDGGQNSAGSAFSRPSSIFLEGDIAAIMEPGFNTPMLSPELEQPSGRGLAGR